MKKLTFLLLLMGTLTILSAQQENQAAQNHLLAQQKDMIEAFEAKRQAQDASMLPASSSNANAVCDLIDDDDDGMPNDWEIQFGLDINDPSDAWLDLDEDGVINLFEFQLDADPNDESKPNVVDVLETGSLSGTIEGSPSGTLIRIEGGTYFLSYSDYHFNSRRLMLQGSWNATFTERDVCAHPTILTANGNNSIMNISTKAGTSAMVLDGLILEEGYDSFGCTQLDAGETGTAFYSVINTIIRDNESNDQFSGGGLFIDHNDESATYFHFINSLAVINQSSGIYNQTSGTACGKWKIINSTISMNQDPGCTSDCGHGLDGFTLEGSVWDIDMVNSIIWGNENIDLELHGFGQPITVNASHSDVGSTNFLSSVNYFDDGTNLNIDPLFMNPAMGDFSLAPNSPLREAGIDVGLPFTGTAPNIGASPCDLLMTDLKSEPVAEVSFQFNAYPNPAAGDLQFNYEIETGSVVSMELRNLLGQSVKKWNPAYQSPGTHQLILQEHTLSAGTYFASLTVGNTTQSIKIVISR